MYKRSLLAATAVPAVLFFSHTAFADAETDALRQQIRALEARLDQLEKEKKSPAPAPAVQAAPVSGNVGQRLAILERKQELAEEDSKSKAEKNPSIEYGAKGLVVASPQKDFQLRLRGYAQADTRTFFHDKSSNTNQFLIRTARPVIDAKFYNDFSTRLMWDFGSGTTRLVDAYADYSPSKRFNIRAGKFKTPIGIERWQSEQDTMFVERGMPTNLVPFRDIGFQFYGDILPQQLEYQLAFTNGSVDLGDSSGDTDNTKDVTARLFATPFRNSDFVMLQGFGVGVSGSYGEHNGSTTNTALTEGYRTPAQARFFTYQSGAYADGVQWRINPQAYYYNGPFGLLAEYILQSQEITRSGQTANLKNNAWMVAAGYVLTGEDESFDGVKIRDNFDLQKGTWGAWEVLGRVGSLHVGDRTFSNFANLNSSAKAANEATGGLTWYLNNSLKLNVDYSLTRFEGGATGGTDRPSEKVLMTRTQFRF